MTATVKLSSALEQRLREHCVQTGLSLSEVMRQALEAHLDHGQGAAPTSAWELGADLFGRHAGPVDLAEGYRVARGDVWEAVAASRASSQPAGRARP